MRNLPSSNNFSQSSARQFRQHITPEETAKHMIPLFSTPVVAGLLEVFWVWWYLHNWLINKSRENMINHWNLWGIKNQAKIIDIYLMIDGCDWNVVVFGKLLLIWLSTSGFERWLSSGRVLIRLSALPREPNTNQVFGRGHLYQCWLLLFRSMNG